MTFIFLLKMLHYNQIIAISIEKCMILTTKNMCIYVKCFDSNHFNYDTNYM